MYEDVWDYDNGGRYYRPMINDFYEGNFFTSDYYLSDGNFSSNFFKDAHY